MQVHELVVSIEYIFVAASGIDKVVGIDALLSDSASQPVDVKVRVRNWRRIIRFHGTLPLQRILDLLESAEATLRLQLVILVNGLLLRKEMRGHLQGLVGLLGVVLVLLAFHSPKIHCMLLRDRVSLRCGLIILMRQLQRNVLPIGVEVRKLVGILNIVSADLADVLRLLVYVQLLKIVGHANLDIVEREGIMMLVEIEHEILRVRHVPIDLPLLHLVEILIIIWILDSFEL